MNKKTGLLVAVAAFAVTVSGAYAFDATMLKQAGLTDEQIEAFERAKELRNDGDMEAARNALVEAGIDQETMHGIRRAMHEEKHTAMEAVRTAIENEDYEAFIVAAQDSPFLEAIQTERDFKQLVEAHALMDKGERVAADELLAKLGIEQPVGHGRHGRYGHMKHLEEELSEEQLAAFETAKEANDKDTMHAILEEAGLTPPEDALHRGGW